MAASTPMEIMEDREDRERDVGETTGKSKGALLTHRNMVSVTASVKAMGIELSMPCLT